LPSGVSPVALATKASSMIARSRSSAAIARYILVRQASFKVHIGELERAERGE